MNLIALAAQFDTTVPAEQAAAEVISSLDLGRDFDAYADLSADDEAKIRAELTERHVDAADFA